MIMMMTMTIRDEYYGPVSFCWISNHSQTLFFASKEEVALILMRMRIMFSIVILMIMIMVILTMWFEWNIDHSKNYEEDNGDHDDYEEFAA